MTELDQATFKEVLGHFATGVAVITATADGQPVGFTCQTFAALSLDPLLITFAAQTRSNSWPKVRDAKNISVAVLRADQESIARTFATSGADKFASVAWRPNADGTPELGDALARIAAEIIDVRTHGDHDVVVARVTGLECSAGEPLLYFRGGFGTFSQ